MKIKENGDFKKIRGYLRIYFGHVGYEEFNLENQEMCYASKLSIQQVLILTKNNYRWVWMI